MKVADYVINYLADYGVTEMFVLYGAANGDLIDAFTRTTKTRYVAMLHEQAAGFAAEGYAKVKGKPGVAIVTSGPGATNVLTPVCNCFYDSVSCLFITGQINSRFLRSDPSIRQVGFQETDIVSMAQSVTKYAKLVLKPDDIRYELEKALFLSSDGRPGPALLDIPMDVQRAEIDPDALEGFDVGAATAAFDLVRVDEQIDRFLGDLRRALRPVLLVGGGARTAGAVEEVRNIGRGLRIPCFPTWNALDVITSDFQYYGGRVGTYGGPGRNFGVQNADLLLAIGCRISGRITGGNLASFARAAKKYVVDVDHALLQRRLQQVPADENIQCDARIFSQRLLDRIGTLHRTGSLPSFEAWTKRALEWRDKYDPVKPEYFRDDGYTYEGKAYVHPYAFVRLLSEKMGEGDIVVGDLGGNSVLVGHALKTRFGQRYVTNNGHAPMGFSFAASIGAWLGADPRRQVVCLTGDGGFNMNIQELQTLLNYDVKVKTFILNNHIYGITKQFQETNFQGRNEACGPLGYRPPNFVRVVEGYGIKTFAIEKNSDMDAQIDRVLSWDGPVVCDVNSHEFRTYEPRLVGWATPIEDMYPYLPREEFRANMIIEPLENWLNPTYPDVRAKESTME